ncbi:MAG: hypothetical protein CVT63_08320 [Candidatus Anoxymicrobium japonicum]|uniref:Uncharacterized protein n=1 Tax=Candidatus Anoxymicrobium japonicum TaxID=2013648 RepID=A0A2N3G2A3_9ACTN|nr:MAG: hypothetical protein CVT63_08320 [Candidatus Anoxymicrobium japonicum]
MIFGIGAAGDGLTQAAHESRQVAQARAQQRQAPGIGDQRLGTQRCILLGFRKQTDPPISHFFIGPLCRHIRQHLHHHMQVIAHHRICPQRHREHLSQLLKTSAWFTSKL